MSELLKNTSPGLHLWGSYPAPGLEQGLTEVLDTVAPYLRFGMPDLELDTPTLERKDWVIGNLKRLRDDTPGIVVVKPGNYDNYDDMAVMDIAREGLDPFDIHLDYFEVARASLLPLRQKLREFGREDLPVQVGIPGYRQYPTFAFGQYKGQLPKYLNPLKKAMQDEQVRLVRDAELSAEGGLALQTEHPVETLAVLDLWRKNKTAGKAFALFMGHGIAQQHSDMPRLMRRAKHYCYGRFKGAPLLAPDPEERGAYEPVVMLSNAAEGARRKYERPAEVVGIPVVPEGGELPSQKAQNEIAAQLGDLSLSQGTRLALGVITYKTTDEGAIARFTDKVQERVGAPTMAVAPCGLSSLRAHPDPQAALKVLQRHVRVLQLRDAV